MITGLIHAARPDDPETIDRLADTLASLVTGVAAGLVGDAVIVTAAASVALETIAEGSGAELIVTGSEVSPWHAGARAARREWVLCLEAGDVLREGWIRTLDRFVGTARSDVALARLHRSHAGLRERLGKDIDRLIGVAQPRAGDLVRSVIVQLGPSFRPRLKPRLLTVQIERA